MIVAMEQTPTRAYQAGSTAASIAGVVGAYFGLRVCLTFLFFRSDPQAGAAVSFALNLLLVIPVALYAAGPGSIKLSQAIRVMPFSLVLAFLGLALVSLIWSETQSITVAFAYWCALAANVALVFLLIRGDHSGDAAESLFKGYIYGVLILAMVAWASPEMADLRLGNDEFLNPSVIGFECAFGALLCQHLAPQGARWKWLGAVLAITLVRSLSKTSIIAFVVAEIFYLSKTNTIGRHTKTMLALASLFVVVAFWGLFVAYYAIYLNASTQAETLTGRTGIWLVAIGMALEKPWFGHGFHSFRNTIPAFGAFEPWHAHNELIQQFFIYGITGVTLLIALYTSLLRQLRHYAQNPLSVVGKALLLLVIIRGFADTENFDLSFPLWAITAISLTLAQMKEATA
jgi:exopolysaccharide production protein ExoQ